MKRVSWTFTHRNKPKLFLHRAASSLPKSTLKDYVRAEGDFHKEISYS